MYLVPEDVINSWRAEQRANAVDQPINTVVNQVDTKMTQLLDSDMSDYDKEVLFAQELGKYMNMRHQKQAAQLPPPAQNKTFTPDMMASIPKMYRTKAAGLIEYLKSDQDVTWDNEGHLYIGQQKIDKSHILDLVHDAMRLRKKTSRPQGWQELSAHLRKKNVPKELVGNPRWFTPPSSPDKGIKRKSFFESYSYIPTPSKKRVIGTKTPKAVGKTRQIQAKKWTAVKP